ncbi:MAG: hypothetical protein AAFN44_06160, partial [Pseudomonadota bacterium]
CERVPCRRSDFVSQSDTSIQTSSILLYWHPVTCIWHSGFWNKAIVRQASKALRGQLALGTIL